MGELSLRRISGPGKISTASTAATGANSIAFNVESKPAFFALQVNGPYTYENGVVVSGIATSNGVLTGIRYQYNTAPKLVSITGTWNYSNGVLTVTFSGYTFTNSVEYDLYYM